MRPEYTVRASPIQTAGCQRNKRACLEAEESHPYSKFLALFERNWHLGHFFALILVSGGFQPFAERIVMRGRAGMGAKMVLYLLEQNRDEEALLSDGT